MCWLRVCGRCSSWDAAFVSLFCASCVSQCLRISAGPCKTFKHLERDCRFATPTTTVREGQTDWQCAEQNCRCSSSRREYVRGRLPVAWLAPIKDCVDKGPFLVEGLLLRTLKCIHALRKPKQTETRRQKSLYTVSPSSPSNLAVHVTCFRNN